LKILTHILLLLARLFALLPHKIIINFGKLIGNIFKLIDKKRVKITLENIKSAYPNQSNEFIEDIKNGAYENLGIVMAEVMSFLFKKPDKIKKLLIYENPELLTNTYEKQKGMILLSGHFGNWECLALSAGFITQQPIHVIVKKQANPIIDKYLNDFRRKSGNEMIYMDKAALKTYKILKNKGIIAMLVDQAAPKKTGLFVDFFSRKASTYEAPASLALKNDIPIIIGFAIRDNNYKYRIHLREIKYDDLKNNENAIELLTQRHVNILEDEIIKYPHLWAWQHKRWKHIKD